MQLDSARHYSHRLLAECLMHKAYVLRSLTVRP